MHTGHGAPPELVARLVAGSRTLGADPSLVLHGGGNTSLKVPWADRTGRERHALLIKGSGHDLATIGPEGFAPLCLDRVRELLPPTDLDDLALADELRCARLTGQAPDPSVETLVHALLPHPAVFHSHPDVLLTVTNTIDGARWLEEVLGERVVIVPYAMPGPGLAAACATAWQAHLAADIPGSRGVGGTDDARGSGAGVGSGAGGGIADLGVVEGMVVLQHGLFTFGADPEEALARHQDLLDTVTDALEVRLGRPRTAAVSGRPGQPDPLVLARLRAELSAVAGTPLIVRQTGGEDLDRRLIPEVLTAVERGPVTPDHALWTRPFPLVGTDVTGYAERYRRYVASHAEHRQGPLTPLDPAPRVVLAPRLGLLAVGRTASEARRAEDITCHTLAVVTDAEALGGYAPASSAHVFDLEYWTLQQAKLERAHAPAPLTGTVALVTGAASGIGRACAEELLAAGAAVIALDRDPRVVTAVDAAGWLGVQVDVTDSAALGAALGTGVAHFGGIDIVVVGAGIFPTTAPLTELAAEAWRETMAVNVDSVAALYRLVGPLLQVSPYGGRVVVVASRNVPAPGPGAGAYSASKAALTQLSRVAALEWAPHGVRVNLVHPDAVFDTGLWTEELLAARAAHYGLSVADYKRRNLLQTEVTSRAVARLVRAMADETFACTTGAQVPIDGGNERVI